MSSNVSFTNSNINFMNSNIDFNVGGVSSRISNERQYEILTDRLSNQMNKLGKIHQHINPAYNEVLSQLVFQNRRVISIDITDFDFEFRKIELILNKAKTEKTPENKDYYLRQAKENISKATDDITFKAKQVYAVHELDQQNQIVDQGTKKHNFSLLTTDESSAKPKRSAKFNAFIKKYDSTMNKLSKVKEEILLIEIELNLLQSLVKSLLLTDTEPKNKKTELVHKKVLEKEVLPKPVSSKVNHLDLNKENLAHEERLATKNHEALEKLYKKELKKKAAEKQMIRELNAEQNLLFDRIKADVIAEKIKQNSKLAASAA